MDPLETVRAGLALLIDGEPDLQVLADASSPDESIRRLGAIRRERLVVLVALAIAGDHDAFWLIRKVREAHPGHTILAMGSRARPLSISRALFVGADGFLDKSVPPQEFTDGIRRAVAGDMVLVGQAASRVGAIARGIDRYRLVEGTLTQREREVLALSAEGLTAREAARRLGVSERTVTTHLTRIYGKLGVRGKLEAVRAAAAVGIAAFPTDE